MSYASVIAADSPTAYWRLGEASGTSAADASGNSQTGTYEGTPTLGATGLLTGDSDTAVTLNGTTQDVLLPTDVASLAGATSLISIEAWFKTTVGNVTIVGCRSSTSANQILTVGVSSGFLFLQVRDNSGVGLLSTTISDTRVDDGARHHVVLTRDSSKVWRFYLDGVIVGKKTDTMANPVTGLDWSYIGRERRTGVWLNGTVDEVAVYKSIVLTDAQVRDHYSEGSQEGTTTGSDPYTTVVLADSPAAYYRLAETAGIRAIDASGNGNHGARRNGAGVNNAGLIGPTDPHIASTLDGTNDRIDLPTLLAITSATGEVTIEAWIAVTTSAMIVGCRNPDSGNPVLDFSIVSGHLQIQARNDNNTGLITLGGAANVTAGILHHVVVTRTGSDKKWRLYVDGSLDATSAADSISSITGLVYTAIGVDRSNTALGFLNGTIDEVALYTVALSGSQILAHFNAGKTVRLPFIASITVVHAPTLQSMRIDIPFISSVSTVYAATLQGSIDVPFIASVTVIYPPALQGAVTAPFIASVTVVYAPTLSFVEVDVPFISSRTRVFGVFSLYVDTLRAGVPGNGGESFQVILAANGSTETATLAAGLAADASLLTVTGDSGFPAGAFVVRIDDEQLYVVKITAGAYRIRRRGSGNTTPASHTIGANVTWTDSYDLAIRAGADIAHSFTADIASSGSTSYPGWLICFDSSQAYLSGNRYPMHVTEVVGVFDAGAGTTGTNRLDAAQPNAICTAAATSEDCPAALSNPARIDADILVGDVAVVRYTNPEAANLELGPRSVALQSWFGLKRVSTSDVDVTFTDPNGIVVDTTGTYDTFTGSVNGEWNNPLGPGIGCDTGEPTNHDVPYTSVTLLGTNRNFTVTSEKGWPICALAVRQGKRRVPFWCSWDWRDYSYVYTGFDTDATFVQLLINRNGILFGSVPEVALPGSQDIDGPDAIWDDGSYRFGASWYVAIFSTPYIVVGPSIGGTPPDLPVGPTSYVPGVSFTGGPSSPSVSVPDLHVEGGSGGGINPPSRADRFDVAHV